MTTKTPPLPFPVTPRRPGDPEADLTGFSLIHRALRSGTRDLAVAVTGIATGAPCPPERHRAVVHFATEVLAEIHVHHSREDDVLWPVIAASAGAAVDLEPLTEDHTELHAVLARAEQALAAFAAPGADLRATAAPLGTVLTGMADLLDEHIAEEEAEVFPVIRTHVSAKDFAACEKRFQKGSSPAHLLFVLPWVIGQCTPAERAAVLGEAPVPLKLLLTLGERRWHRRHALVVGA
ncbi:hemerythrin domain-containing protein [Geodermatophilus sp. SYSU D00691]